MKNSVNAPSDQQSRNQPSRKFLKAYSRSLKMNVVPSRTFAFTFYFLVPRSLSDYVNLA